MHDGGALMNQCIHDIDLLRWLMWDEITEITGITDRLRHDYIESWKDSARPIASLILIA